MATIAAAAIDQPLVAVQGATFEMAWVFNDIDNVAWDWLGYTAKLEVRKAPGAAGDPIITASTANGRIALIEGGELRITIPFDVITALTFKGNEIEYWYDLELTRTTVSPNRVLKPFLPSTFTIVREVTK